MAGRDPECALLPIPSDPDARTGLDRLLTGSVAEVWVAGLVLLLTHFGISSTSLRDRMVRRVGEGPFRGLYSLIAAAALVWLILAWRASPPGAVLWSLGSAGQAAAVILVPVALFLLVGGLTVPNPTAVGAERHLEDPRPVTGVLRITRNPGRICRSR